MWHITVIPNLGQNVNHSTDKKYLPKIRKLFFGHFGPQKEPKLLKSAKILHFSYFEAIWTELWHCIDLQNNDSHFFTKLEYLIVVSKTAQTMLAIGSIFAFSNVCTKYNQCHNSKVYIILDLDLKFHKCHHILLWAISFKIYSHESFRLHLHYTVNSKTKMKPASIHSFSKTYIKSDWILHSMLLEDNISS